MVQEEGLKPFKILIDFLFTSKLQLKSNRFNKNTIMPAFKNQHFVPQCYLRPFGNNDQEKAKSINLFNLKSHRLIENAPIKNQCSQDYFYGKDLHIEKLLHNFEGSYSELCKKILLNPTYQMDENDKNCLLNFWHVQYIRTELYIKEALLSFEQIVHDNELQNLIDKSVLNKEQTTKIIMQNIGLADLFLKDLNCILIRNNTPVPFITSDNPAILTNRYHFKKDLFRYFSFGLNSAGIILVLPLSPKVCFFAYDKNIYTIPHKNEILNLKKALDVELINQFQVSNCNYNLYLNEISYFEKYYQKYLNQRLNSRYKINYAILDDANHGHKTYKLIPNSQISDHKDKEMIIHQSNLYPKPKIWPSFLHWHIRGYCYSANCGSGHVRENFKYLLNPNNVHKVKI